MKIAIPTYNEMVMDYIGTCPFYMIYTVAFENIIKEETFTVPDDSLNSASVALLLAEKGVEIMLTGKIGIEEIELLVFHGIKVYFNCKGNVRELVNIFIKGDMTDQEWKEKDFNKISKN